MYSKSEKMYFLSDMVILKGKLSNNYEKYIPLKRWYLVLHGANLGLTNLRYESQKPLLRQ